MYLCNGGFTFCYVGSYIHTYIHTYIHSSYQFSTCPTWSQHIFPSSNTTIGSCRDRRQEIRCCTPDVWCDTPHYCRGMRSHISRETCSANRANTSCQQTLLLYCTLSKLNEHKTSCFMQIIGLLQNAAQNTKSYPKNGAY